MTDRSEPNWDELAAYFAGEASVHEVDAIEAWAGQSVSNARSLEQLRRAWTESGSLARSRTSIDTEAGWARMHARLGALHEVPEPASPTRPLSISGIARRPHRSSRGQSLRIAAAAALLFIVSGVFAWERYGATSSERSSAPPAMREYTAARGQRANIRLPDGTQVVLAPDSRLLVPETFGSAVISGGKPLPREVNLQGRAYFAVVHDEQRPFLVRTAAGVARDLGTEFQVRAYREMRGMEVTVVSGLVSLERVISNQSLAKLKPGDQAMLSTNGAMTIAHSVDISAARDWTEGKLVFDGTPLSEVAMTLSRWYDLDIQLGDKSISKRHLALTLEDESPQVVLKMIALSLDLNVEWNEHSVRLYPRRSSQKR